MDYNLFFGVIQSLLGALCIVLWAMLTETKKKAERVEADLAQYKVEAAMSFSTKHELQSAIEAVSRAIEQQGNKIDSRFDRIEDRLIEASRGH
jgi:lipopolysaccharide biosynthesis regulator YciM